MEQDSSRSETSNLAPTASGTLSLYQEYSVENEELIEYDNNPDEVFERDINNLQIDALETFDIDVKKQEIKEEKELNIEIQNVQTCSLYQEYNAENEEVIECDNNADEVNFEWDISKPNPQTDALDMETCDIEAKKLKNKVKTEFKIDVQNGQLQAYSLNQEYSNENKGGIENDSNLQFEECDKNNSQVYILIVETVDNIEDKQEIVVDEEFIADQNEQDVVIKDKCMNDNSTGTMESIHTASTSSTAHSEIQITPLIGDELNTFTGADHFEENMTTNKGDGPLRCNVCSQWFSDYGVLKEHMFTHSDRRFKCILCSLSYTTIANLRKHLATHIRDTPSGSSPDDSLTAHTATCKHETQFKCTACSYCTQYSSNLKRHVVQKHSGDKLRATRKDEKLFKCTACLYSSTYRSNLKRHMSSHKGEKPKRCTMCKFKSVQLSDIKYHSHGLTGVTPYKCTECSAGFSHPRTFKAHMARHVDSTPIECSLCSYKCFKITELQKHMSTHVIEKRKKIPQSPFSNLKRNMITHTDEKLFKCTKCVYRCAYSDQLKSHMVATHTDKKPFECSKCLYTCTRPDRLKAHMFSCHNAGKSKCSDCSYTCTHPDELQKHMYTHIIEKPKKSIESPLRNMVTHINEKSLKCTKCMYRCARSDQLKEHMRVEHTGGKRFKCLTCLYTCTHLDRFKKHIMFNHTDEQPFECPMCPFGCANPDQLRVHMAFSHTVELQEATRSGPSC